MRIAVFGRNRRLAGEYRKSIKSSGLIYDEKKPELVISLGGDGTFLMAERIYPGVPKLLIRDGNVCVKCEWDSLTPLLKHLKQRRFRLKEYRKLELRFRGKSKLAANDVVIRNKNPMHAIRFLVYVNGKRVDGTMIGDGLVIATPFGSTAYYYSITKKKFSKGIGIAFNNISADIRHVNLQDGAKIRIKMVRGPATLSWDNDPSVPVLKDGEEIEVKLSNSVARITKII
ncbi:MAG: NAD(+)/NADH kinase [Candidatus Aenigmarchaeota archaeon]|nr:NAD(+)/NADH kinase [Candidatus Aenigmarchaeota archaeon]